MSILRLQHGDCLVRLEEVGDGTITAFICDPPYDLTQASRGGSPRPPGTGPFGRHTLGTHEHDRGVAAPGGGFMGKTWDATGIAFDQKFWEIVRRKLQPGGIVKAFGGTRTYHKMVQAMRRAGLVDVCVIGWGYASGFPKSLNISKAIDRQAKVERKIVGYKRGVGGENMNDLVRGKDVRQTTEDGARGVGAYGTGAKQVAIDVPITLPATELAELWDGYGSALKPAWEPIVGGRKT